MSLIYGNKLELLIQCIVYSCCQLPVNELASDVMHELNVSVSLTLADLGG